MNIRSAFAARVLRSPSLRAINVCGSFSPIQRTSRPGSRAQWRRRSSWREATRPIRCGCSIRVRARGLAGGGLNNIVVPRLHRHLTEHSFAIDSHDDVVNLSWPRRKVHALMRKTSFAFAAFLLMLVLACATTVLNASRTYSATSQNSEIYGQLNLFGGVLDVVRSKYVEEPDDAKLIESAITGMLSALDPHSAYMNPKDYRDLQTQTRGEFGGLGLEVTMENGVVKVVSPIDDTPAAKAGLLANDLITQIDGEQIAGLTLEQAVEKMRGPVNTPITLTIVRKGVDNPFDVKVVRDIVHINPVKAHNEGDVAYIKVTSFNEQTHADLVKAIDEAKKTIGKDLKGYIIDLRNNPGGLLDQAIAVSDDFLEDGAIVITKGRNRGGDAAGECPPGR